MNSEDASILASRLCVECGMCCNGVLFDLVVLQKEDSPQKLTALKLKIKRAAQENVFAQPCTALQGGGCSIYLDRPTRCRAFECRQLKSAIRGAITTEMALDKISAAKQLVEQVETLLLQTGGTNLRKPLKQRFATVMAESVDPALQPELAGLRNQLWCAMENLNRMLDAHFRVEV